MVLMSLLGDSPQVRVVNLFVERSLREAGNRPVLLSASAISRLALVNRGTLIVLLPRLVGVGFLSRVGRKYSLRLGSVSLRLLVDLYGVIGS